jgi:hypothetical protein
MAAGLKEVFFWNRVVVFRERVYSFRDIGFSVNGTIILESGGWTSVAFT